MQAFPQKEETSFVSQVNVDHVVEEHKERERLAAAAAAASVNVLQNYSSSPLKLYPKYVNPQYLHDRKSSIRKC